MRILFWSLLIATLCRPTFGQVPSKDPAGIFDGRGGFNAQAYQNMASAWGTAAMIPERFGGAWTQYHHTLQAPTLFQAANLPYQSLDAYTRYQSFWYSIGGPTCVKDRFQDNYAQVAYVYDPAVPNSAPGVDGIATMQKDKCVWSGKPQLYWGMTSHTYVGGQPTVTLQIKNPKVNDPYGIPQQPVAVVRAAGAGEAIGCSYMVFQSGQIACGEGGNTAIKYAYFKPLPAKFVPTAASVTNNGEFLLVTGWDVSTLQGGLAVLAVGSSMPANWGGWEWNEDYPGFRNYSMPDSLKLLGILPLPGMRAPTMVEGVGNWVFGAGAFLPMVLPAHAGQDYGQPGNYPLSIKANWDCFATGKCAKFYDTAGFALVGSRWERRVLLIDLTPLFQMVKAAMFTDFARFRWNVANTGLSTGQYPPTFAELPSETPVIVTTIDYSSPVTAVSASVYADNRALIATEEGDVHIWDVDGLQTGGKGSAAHEVAHDTVGHNITCFAHFKHWLFGNIHGAGDGQLVRWQWMALSRGDRTVTWIDFSSGKPQNIKSMTDSRLVDPIWLEDNNNHMTESHTIDIADYGAKDIKGYRYGPVVFWQQGDKIFGMGATGTDPFEYEGSYGTPTGPFAISSENIP